MPILANPSWRIREFITIVATVRKFPDGSPSLFFPPFFFFQFIYAEREIARLFRDDYSARLISNELETILHLPADPSPSTSPPLLPLHG